jgi:hypothetical protein
MPIVPASKLQPLSKAEFHKRLREWVENTNEARVGDPDDDNRQPCAYVSDGGNVFRLHSDTQRDGVKEYLALVSKHGDDLEWSIVQNRDGKMNKLAYGPTKKRLSYFYLYLNETV